VQNRPNVARGEPSRATAIAEAVAVAQRREARGLIERSSPVAAAAGPSAQHRDTSLPNAVPLGQGHRRRAQTRVSASARKRDVKP
jgi:type IV secretion system protein VirB6